jgi:hypothetical protein
MYALPRAKACTLPRERVHASCRRETAKRPTGRNDQLYANWETTQLKIVRFANFKACTRTS